MNDQEREVFDCLLNAATNLRAAQKAYMADRGNELKGRLVGQMATELDDAIEAAKAA